MNDEIKNKEESEKILSDSTDPDFDVLPFDPEDVDCEVDEDPDLDIG